MERLLDEMDEAYCFAYENSDTTTPEGLEQYRLMNQCIEQYRREYCGKLLKTLNKKTVSDIGQGEIHLHLKWTILERLQQILDNEWNFLVYAYHQNDQDWIGKRKDRKEHKKTRGVHRNQPTKAKANNGATRDTK